MELWAGIHLEASDLEMGVSFRGSLQVGSIGGFGGVLLIKTMPFGQQKEAL